MTWMASNPVNCINPTFLDHLDHTLAVLERDNATRPSPVVFASASGMQCGRWRSIVLDHGRASLMAAHLALLWLTERTFCAGLDLKAVLAMSREELTHFIDRYEHVSSIGCLYIHLTTWCSLNQSYLRLLTLACPTVAAVNGHAIAGGALVALSADYRVSASSSTPLIYLLFVLLRARC